MKKIIVLCLSIIMLFSLCACSVTEKKADSYIDRIYQCSSSDFKEIEKLRKFLDKYGEDDIFVNAVVERIKTENLNWSISFLEKLTDSGRKRDSSIFHYGYNYYNETVRKAFGEKIYAMRDLAFQNSEDVTFESYWSDVSDYGDGGFWELEYYFPKIIDCLPYDVFKAYIVENYDVAITKDGQGGYYDGNEDYNSSSVHDPLEPPMAHLTNSEHTDPAALQNTQEIFAYILTQKRGGEQIAATQTTLPKQHYLSGAKTLKGARSLTSKLL